MKSPAPAGSSFERGLRARRQLVERGADMAEALRRTIEALAPLDGGDRVLVLRWTADAYYINPYKIVGRAPE